MHHSLRYVFDLFTDKLKTYKSNFYLFKFYRLLGIRLRFYVCYPTQSQLHEVCITCTQRTTSLSRVAEVR